MTKAVVPSRRRRAIDSQVASCWRAKLRACSLPAMSSRTSCRERKVSYCCWVRASSGDPPRSSLVSSTRPAISTAVARARSRGLLTTSANSSASRRSRRAAAWPAADKARPDPSSLPRSAWRRITSETIAVLPPAHSSLVSVRLSVTECCPPGRDAELRFEPRDDRVRGVRWCLG